MDVEYFQNGISKIDFKSFELLGNISEKIQSGSTPAGGKFEEQGVLYLKSADFDLFDIRKTQYITEQFHQKLSRSKVQKGDIIIASVGATIGKIGYYNLEEEANINQNVARIRVKDERFIDKFIANFLYSDLGQKQLLGNSTVNAQPYINNQKLSELKIPLLPLEIQNEIIQKMDEALRIKQQKEAEAKNLLASIDEFVLSELGIEYEEVEEKKVFGLSLSELGESKRLDPFFNNPSFIFFRDLKSNYEVKSIEDIILETKTGLPIRSDNRIENGEYPYYGANGIIGYMDQFTYDGDYIVVGQDGYIGNHYVVHGKFWASNHNWVMKLKNGINLYYVKSVLDVINYDYLVTGGVIPKLTREALMSIKIPLPPLETQNKIAHEVSLRIEKAKRLESEAKEVYESAKKEVESIILES